MQKLLSFLEKLEHNRDEYIMLLVTIAAERWEVEIEVFKNSTGVYSDEKMLDKLFELENK